MAERSALLQSMTTRDPYGNAVVDVVLPLRADAASDLMRIRELDLRSTRWPAGGLIVGTERHCGGIYIIDLVAPAAAVNVMA